LEETRELGKKKLVLANSSKGEKGTNKEKKKGQEEGTIQGGKRTRSLPGRGQIKKLGGTEAEGWGKTSGKGSLWGKEIYGTKNGKVPRKKKKKCGDRRKRRGTTWSKKGGEGKELGKGKQKTGNETKRGKHHRRTGPGWGGKKHVPVKKRPERRWGVGGISAQPALKKVKKKKRRCGAG